MTEAIKEAKVDPVSGYATWTAWSQIAPDATGSYQMPGTKILDAACFGLLKAEFLAAQCGVIPWVDLGDGTKGVMCVGAATEQPASKWPTPELRKLYMLNQNAYAAIHASAKRARGTTPTLPIASVTGKEVQNVSDFFSLAGRGAYALGIGIPVAYLVVGVIAIAGIIAAAWYADRRATENVQVESKRLRDAATIGSLTDLAAKQLASKGTIDDNLIRAITTAGSETSPWTWGYVLLGAGATLFAGGGIWYAFRKYGRRSR